MRHTLPAGVAMPAATRHTTQVIHRARWHAGECQARCAARALARQREECYGRYYVRQRHNTFNAHATAMRYASECRHNVAVRH